MLSAQEYNHLIIIPLYIAGILIAAELIHLGMPKLIKLLAKRTPNKLDDQLLAQLQKPFFCTVFLYGMLKLLETLALAHRLDFYLREGLVATLVMLWSAALAGILIAILDDVLLRKGLHGIHRPQDLLPFISAVIRVSVFGLAVFYILERWGVNITPMLASAGVAGLAVALAAQETLANFFGGLSLSFDQAYKVGDYVVVDDKDRGEVLKIGMRSTLIRTRDNVYLSIPNSVMANSKVVNETGSRSDLRLRIRVGISYQSDPDQVEKAFLEVARSHNKVLKNPEPRVRLREFADSALIYELLVWIHNPEEKGLITHELQTALLHSFKKNRVVIAYPQVDVHLAENQK